MDDNHVCERGGNHQLRKDLAARGKSINLMEHDIDGTMEDGLETQRIYAR
jgi:hypothetical protein